MPHDILLLVILFGPAAILFLLGVNAAVVFLSLCLGQVLVQYVAKDAVEALITFSPHASAVSKSMLQLVFLYGPAIITTVLMLASVHGKMRRLLNILPAAGVGLLAILLGVPQFTPGLRHAVEASTLWHQLNRGQAFLVGLTAIISLLFLWMQRRSISSEERKTNRHRG